MPNDILSALLEVALQKEEGKEKKEETKAAETQPVQTQSSAEKPAETQAPEGQASQANSNQTQLQLGIAMWLNYHAQLSAAKLDFDENLSHIGLPWDKMEALIQQELANNVERYSKDRWAVVSAYQSVKRRLIEEFRRRPELFAALSGRSEATAEEENKLDPREAYIQWLRGDVFKNKQ
jgi:hypothetical protein